MIRTPDSVTECTVCGWVPVALMSDVSRAIDCVLSSVGGTQAEMGNLSEKKLVELELGGNKFKDRKIKQLIEKSVKLVKELTAHLTKQGGGGGGKGKKGKKNPNKK